MSALRLDVRAERAAHAAFLETGAPSRAVRTVVADSWLRSAAAGVDADANLAPLVLEPVDLREYRAGHPLAQVFPLLHDVLGRVAEDCDCVMAVGDAMGQLRYAHFATCVGVRAHCPSPAAGAPTSVSVDVAHGVSLRSSWWSC